CAFAGRHRDRTGHFRRSFARASRRSPDPAQAIRQGRGDRCHGAPSGGTGRHVHHRPDHPCERWRVPDVKNLITDVPGVRVGNAHDARVATGVTVAVFDQSSIASVATMGGAPGSRAVTLLEPEMMRSGIDAVVLSGGSLYGLDAAGGVSAVLCAQGRGASFGGITLPVAVQAILFDL